MYNAIKNNILGRGEYSSGGNFDCHAMLKTYRLGAPISRAKATLPNKFERTFSFFVDPNKDFKAHRRYRWAESESGYYHYSSDDDADLSGFADSGYYGEVEISAGHVSNMYGFYATVEILDRSDSYR